MTANHVFYIPLFLAIGFFFGAMFGKQALTRELAERERDERERTDRQAARAAKKAAKSDASDLGDS